MSAKLRVLTFTGVRKGSEFSPGSPRIQQEIENWLSVGNTANTFSPT